MTPGKEGTGALSLVVVNWNGERFLEPMLSSLVAQTFRDFTLHFVDNGSADGSLAVVDSFADRLRVAVVRLPENRGFAEANDVGIARALEDGGAYVVTLNNDLELDARCLERLDAAIREQDAQVPGEAPAVLQLLMLNYFDRRAIDAAGLRFDRFHVARQLLYKEDLSALYTADLSIDGACAGAAAYPREALLAVRKGETGFFDPLYFAYYEDVDLAMRLMRAGYRTRLVRDAVAYHVHSGTGRKGSPFKAYHLARNFRLYLYRNLPPEEHRRHLWRYRVLSLRMLAGQALRGEFRSIPASLRGLRDYRRIRDDGR